MEVAFGGGQAGVAHGGFDGGEVDAAGDQERAVAVAQVMEAPGAQVGGSAGAAAAAPEGGAVDAASEAVDEDVVVGAGELPAG